MVDVINLIHDRIEGKSNEEDLANAIEYSLTEGPGGIWESVGNWLCKLCEDNAYFNGIWLELSHHRLAKVRFRVASFIDGMPDNISSEVYRILSNDKSKKVSEHARERWGLKNGKYSASDIT